MRNTITIGVMIWQNVITRRASQSANIMQLIQFLQDEETRNARNIVYTEIRNQDLDTILVNERFVWAASKTCVSYDIAGLLIKHGFAKKEIFLESWGASIIDCYQILADFILHRREEIWEEFCKVFEWLHQQAGGPG